MIIYVSFIKSSTYETYLLTILVYLLSSGNNLNAQIAGAPASTYVNQQLRVMFSNIPLPSPQPPIFYDMSAHFVEKEYWQPMQTDTFNTTQWILQYDEMFCGHYDTNQFLRIDTVLNRANRFGGDTVVIGVFEYEYARLVDSAMYDSIYFHIDTTTNPPSLIDNPNSTAYPYIHDTVFNVCAFQWNNTVGNLTMRVDPNFIFLSQNMVLGKSDMGLDRTLEINFGDGQGWHPIDPNNVDHYDVAYTVGGEHTIQARVINNSSFALN